MIRLIKLINALAIFGWLNTQGQRPSPGAKPIDKTIFKGLTLHTGTGKKIVNGLLVIDSGRIIYAGTEDSAPAFQGYTVKEIPNAHAYPGFILLNNILGLIETDALKPTHDYSETGDFNPSVRSCVAFNTDSKIIPTVRSNGALICQSTPRGGLVAGTSAVMRLDAWNWEDAVIKCHDGIHIYWPAKGFQSRGENEKKDAIKTRNQQINRLENFMKESLAYYRSGSPHQEVNLHHQAMVPIFENKSNLYIHASGTVDIADAISFFKQFGPLPLVICGMPDTGLVLDMIKDNNIPIILDRIHELPRRDDLGYDYVYRLPYILQQQGIRFALSYRGDMEAMGARNLPFLGGTAVTFGLDYEEAVKAITLEAAKILKIDKEYGTLEAGKSATFIISSGDAFDMRRNEVIHAFIDGRPLNLDNHQKELYRQYLEKFGLH